MDMRRLVGLNLRRYRRAAALTQEQLAERSGFTQKYISDLERGLENPTIISIYELAVALGISHVHLVLPEDDGTSNGAMDDVPTPRG